MEIRSFVDHDLDGVRALWRTTWRDSYGGRLGPRADDAIETSLGDGAIRSMFADDGDCLVAIDDGTVVGTVCFAERGEVAYVWGMYVRPDRQRRGIGTALLRSAAAAFRQAERVELSTVREEARAFYRKLGFVDRGADEIELFPDLRAPATRLAAAVHVLRFTPRP